MESDVINSPDRSRYQCRPLPSRPQNAENDCRMDHFRLMRLLPDVGDDSIRIQLHIHQINLINNKAQLAAETPAYEAISYCWMNDKRIETVWCDGAKKEVSTVVQEILAQVRLPDRERWVWLDSLCIDQSNLNERAYQVQIMRMIYTSAFRTIMWLGPADHQTSSAFQAVARLKAIREELGWEDAMAMSQYEDPGPANSIRQKYSLPNKTAGDEKIRSLVNLLNHPYFERAWIVQEITVSSEVMIRQGFAETSWNDFACAVLLTLELQMHDGWSENMKTNIANLYFLLGLNRDFRNDTLNSLRVLLNMYRHAKATHLSDKVYALVGISKSSHLGNADTLSYAISHADAYRNWTMIILETERSLDILSAANRYPKSPDLERFSWVPDWSYAGEIPTKHMSGWPAAHLQATKQSQFEPSFSDSRIGNTELILAGHIIDRIEAVSELMVYNTRALVSPIRAHYLSNQYFRDCEAVAGLHRRKKYVNGTESMRDAFWQIMTMGHLSDGSDGVQRGRAEFEAWYYYHRRPFRLLEIIRAHVFYPLWAVGNYLTFLYIVRFLTVKFRSKEISDWEFVKHLIDGNGWRKVVRTEHGYIGLASHKVGVGDTIALFQGGRMPLAIKKSGDVWRLTGDVYIHGLMHGEKWEPP